MIIKKKTKILLIAVFIFVLCFGVYLYINQRNHIGSVGKNIINEIDANGDCTIDLKMVTDFEWDKVIIVSADFFAIGYSKEHIKELWGIEYEFSSGFKSRLIFLKNNSIVHEESYLASIEHPVKFDISVSSGMDYYCILPYDNAYITAEQGEYNSETCYSLIVE